MKRIANLFLTTTLLFSYVVTLSSCSDYEEQMTSEASPVTEANHRVSVEQAMLNALDFVGQLNNSTRSGEYPMTVSNVIAITNDGDITRSQIDSIFADTLFYIINFAENRGYVIAAADNRETPIFAYVEEGAYEEPDTLNGGYKAFIDAITDPEGHKNGHERFKYKEDIDIGGGGGTSGNNNDVFEVKSPILQTKWDQRSYNSYCSGFYTGCVVTAISQICSYLKSPTYVTWTDNGTVYESDIDWDNIVEECSSNNGNLNNDNLKDQIAHLMRYWGVVFNANYTTNGTGVVSTYAIQELRQLGFNATFLKDYNATNIMNDLKQGNKIVYMRGIEGYNSEGGHGWVVDGYIFKRKNNTESIYMHCNWGWGGSSNGYFLSDVFDTAQIAYDDNGQAITRSLYFKYNLQTSTISK